MKIAVFGSGECRYDSNEYALAEKVGELLTSAGHTIITGGYGGIMEAASRGALSGKGRAIGLTMAHKPNCNQYAENKVVGDWFDRLRELMKADVYIIFPGGSGTAVELIVALHLQIRQSSLQLGKKKIIIMGDGYNLNEIYSAILFAPINVDVTICHQPVEILKII